MKNILSVVSLEPNVLIGCDTNNSDRYEKQYQEENKLSVLMKNSGYEASVAMIGDESLKTRGPGSGQKEKVGQLMFDVLDRFYCKKTNQTSMKRISENNYGLVKYDLDFYKDLLEIRTDPIKRQEFKDALLACNTYSNNSIIIGKQMDPKYRPLIHQFYPNYLHPSDHPFIQIVFTF